jgi:hypothetical protein
LSGTWGNQDGQDADGQDWSRIGLISSGEDVRPELNMLKSNNIQLIVIVGFLTQF